jgi:hypothetical protein
VPEDGIREPVDVVEELAAQPRLADPRLSRDRHQPRRAALERAVKQLLDQAQVAVATDERRVQPLLALRPADAAEDAGRAPQAQWIGLSLDHVLAGVLVRDRRRGQLSGHLVDRHRVGPRHRLDARGGVDAVSDDQPLARVVDRRHLAGHDAGPRAQAGGASLLAEHGDRVGDVQSSTYGPLGVILARCRNAPHRHHGVADELLDDAAVALDDRPGGVEVATQQLAHVLGFARFGQGSEPDQIDEQDGHEPKLTGRRCCGPIDDRRGRPGRRDGQAGAALLAEALAGRVRGAANGAAGGQRRPAYTAELRALCNLTPDKPDSSLSPLPKAAKRIGGARRVYCGSTSTLTLAPLRAAPGATRSTAWPTASIAP